MGKLPKSCDHLFFDCLKFLPCLLGCFMRSQVESPGFVQGHSRTEFHRNGKNPHEQLQFNDGVPVEIRRKCISVLRHVTCSSLGKRSLEIESKNVAAYKRRDDQTSYAGGECD